MVRVLRIIEYVGDREWVEHQVADSIHGTKNVSNPNKSSVQRTIRAATIGEYPEILLPSLVVRDLDYTPEEIEDINKALPGEVIVIKKK